MPLIDSAYYLAARDISQQARISGEDFKPVAEQWTTIYFIIGYAVGIAIIWNIPYLNLIIYPFKILTVGLHEFSHAFACVLTGGSVVAITLDPNEGGLTKYVFSITS